MREPPEPKRTHDPRRCKTCREKKKPLTFTEPVQEPVDEEKPPDQGYVTDEVIVL